VTAAPDVLAALSGLPTNERFEVTRRRGGGRVLRGYLNIVADKRRIFVAHRANSAGVYRVEADDIVRVAYANKARGGVVWERTEANERAG
jgi:hypothetical protein